MDLATLAAYEMDTVPFEKLPSDGIVGLGFGPLVFDKYSGFSDRMFESASNRTLQQFGIHLGMSGGSVHFGGHNEGVMDGPLQWFPVHRPDEGYWQVAIRAVSVA